MAIKIGLLGSGTVGTEVVRLLRDNAHVYAERIGDNLELVGITVRDLDRERDPIIDRALLTTDAAAVVEQSDVVVELMGGIDPARTLICDALAAGKDVVTGNKALLATHWSQISQAAEQGGSQIFFEAAVAGAVPVVRALQHSLAGDRVTQIRGILNGTTNFMLDEMTHGATYDQALAKAQELGYAEADPSADVDGLDAGAKIAILATLAFGQPVTLDDVTIEGIRHVTGEDIAGANGHVVKLIASATRDDDDVAAVVEPVAVPLTHPLASVGGAFNAVTISAQAAGDLTFIGQGAGGAPTASAVMSDVVAAARRFHEG